MLGIASALRRAGAGVVQLISDAYLSTDLDLVASESALLGRIATELGRPLSFTVQQVDEAPNRYRDLLASIEQWNLQGAHARAQVAVRPIGVLIGMTASANPLNFCRSVAGLAAAGRDPREMLFDLLLDDEGRRLFYIPLMNYAAGNLDDVRDMLMSPNAILGLSDAGPTATPSRTARSRRLPSRIGPATARGARSCRWK